jgi:hypothetical protein
MEQLGIFIIPPRSRSNQSFQSIKLGIKVWFFYQSGTRMQDILIQLGQNIMQLHSHAKMIVSIVGQKGKFGQNFPLGK